MMNKNIIYSFVFVGIVTILSGCFLTATLAPDGVDPKIKRYLAYNLWYEKADNVWSTNYKTGMVLPAGTPVSNVRIGSKRGHRLIAFNVPTMNNAEFIIPHTARHHGNLSFINFKKRMFTTQNFKKLTKGFTKQELEAIRSLRPYICKNMSKKAAIMAWGYPPEVATPSTKLNVWKYWINRYRTVLVTFNKNGKAVDEVQAL